MLTIVNLYLVKANGRSGYMQFVVPGYIVTVGVALEYIKKHYDLSGCEIRGAGLTKTDVAVLGGN